MIGVTLGVERGDWPPRSLGARAEVRVVGAVLLPSLPLADVGVSRARSLPESSRSITEP